MTAEADRERVRFQYWMLRHVGYSVGEGVRGNRRVPPYRLSRCLASGLAGYLLRMGIGSLEAGISLTSSSRSHSSFWLCFMRQWYIGCSA